MNLNTVIWDNPLSAWLTAAAALMLSLLVLRLLRGFLAARLKKLAEKTATTIDDLIAELAAKTKFLFLLGISIFLASKFLELPEKADSAIGSAAILLALFQAAVWGSVVVQYVIRQYVRLEGEEELAASSAALSFLGKLLLWSLIFILALDNLGFDITALITSLGIGGIAVALAVQNILGDLFASLSIMLDKPFVVGDFIVVDNFSCTVEHVGLKTTRARSLTGEQLVFANSDLLKSRLRNFKRMQERRATLLIGVVYQTPAEKLTRIPEILKDVVEKQSGSRFDRAHFKEFGNSSLNFEMVYWVESPQYLVFMDVLQAVNLEIFRRFEQEEIEFAYPTQTLFIERD